MAYPEDQLSSAQQRALARLQQAGTLRSGKGVSAPTMRVLERMELAQVTWSRKAVRADHDLDGWQVHKGESWTAVPIIDDYKALIMTPGETFRLTVYAAPGRAAAYLRAKELFEGRYPDGERPQIQGIVIEPLIDVAELLLV